LIFLDFCSGIGGFRLGMEQAGHTCAGHCEIDRFANISYNAIHQPKEGEWFATDIRAVEPGQLPDADCWCAGFPCQAFSIAGKRAGFEDMRGTIIFEIFRLAKQRKPKILLLENVAGLLSHDEGRTMATILCGFWELGYDVQWQVLNSKDYGVPQNRERIFFVGHLGAGSSPKVFPISEGNGTDIVPTENNRVRLMHDHRQSAETRIYNNNSPTVTQFWGAGGGNVPYVLDDTQGFDGTRYYVDETPTLRSQRSGLKVVDNMTIRKLTPRETFRLQGFPDWAFDRAQGAGVSDSQLYKQAGNSVTTTVVYEIARRLEQ